MYISSNDPREYLRICPHEYIQKFHSILFLHFLFEKKYLEVQNYLYNVKIRSEQH